MNKSAFLLVMAILLPTPIPLPGQGNPIAGARNVRISFVPPPQEGTISLGIYDGKGRLVRVLQREAAIDHFHIGPDALMTAWDGKDDEGRDLPPGRYAARGFAVGEMKIQETSRPAGTEALPTGGKVSVKLVPNPLQPGERKTVELRANFDDETSFVETSDGLPLFTVDECPFLWATTISARPDRTFLLQQTDGDTVDEFQISGVQEMMAFDAGEFELK